MSKPGTRTWGDAYQLEDLLEGSAVGRDFAVRDFALLTLAKEFSAQFPGQLVFKGGFVLRHVHGLMRLSRDVDATRYDPPEHKLDADDVAHAIRSASVGDIVRFAPDQPATNSARSLDFDRVDVTGALIDHTQVQVEISYREGIVDPPVPTHIGGPYYENFEVLAMAPQEMAAEKLRAIAQRVRVTDLADLAELLTREDVIDGDVARLAAIKFELVKQGAANRVGRVNEHLAAMRADYDEVVPGFFPAARTYAEAMDVVWPRVRPLIP